MRGKSGGFTQANHGKPYSLRQMQAGDWLIFYSPKTAYGGGEPLQAFTALARVKDNELYQMEMSPDFMPWRRNMTFEVCSEVPIQPLVNDLEFIQDKTHWGYKFRFGVFEINEHDFAIIHQAMQAIA